MPINQEIQPQIPKTPIRFLVYVTKPFKGWALAAILVVMLAATLSQSTALFFKWIVEAVEQGDKEAALLYGLMYPFAILIVQLLYRVSGLLGMNWMVNTKQYTNDVLFEYTLNHSHTYFSNRFAGSLLNKISNVVGAVDTIIHDILWSYLDTFVALTATMYFIFQVDILSGIIFIAMIVAIIIFNRFRMGKKQEYSRLNAAASSTLRGDIVDVFTNIGAVRQFGTRTQEADHVSVLAKKWRDTGKKSWTYSEITQVMNSLILFVFASTMFFVLAERWRADEISTADFIFVLTLISYLTGTLIHIGRAMTMYARVIGEATEGLEEIIVPYEITDPVGAKTLAITDAAIQWSSVEFEFGDNKVFDNFNLAIKSGERIGLVGHSGAGKTTFVSLLLRQHDVTGGAIMIDGQNIADVTQDSLRSGIAVVPQEPMLFHRTIRENIAYGKPDATDEEIIAVAKKAQAHDFINQLEKGYDTMVGERGIKLSGGQKQRVAIARAMLKNAPILVLDEATSALDSESEVAIQEALHKLMEGKTVVAVAHRLSTLREMDRIIVMENGKIIEDGTHESLKEASGVYQRLWEHQAGGFLAE